MLLSTDHNTMPMVLINPNIFKRGAKPDKIPDASGKTVEDYWGPSKRIMAEPKFVDELNAFEKDDINAKTMKLIRDKYINNKEIDPDESKVSMVFTWIVLEVNHLPHLGELGICNL